MTPKPTLVEKMAQAIYEDGPLLNAGRIIPWAELIGPVRIECLSQARAALAVVMADLAQPSEAMWGGLARDIMMWLSFSQPTGAALFKHLNSCGAKVPDWLRSEVPDIDHVPSKGTRCVIVFRAMLSAFEREST